MLPWSAKTAAVIVVGDVMIDEYVDGEVVRVSPEAPVPIIDVQKEWATVGGAANTAANCVQLGGEAHLMSVVGQGDAADFIALIEKYKPHLSHHLIAGVERLTTRKTRIISHGHQICRVDRETRSAISKDLREQLLSRFEKTLVLQSGVQAILLSDYGKGVLEELTCRELILRAEYHGIPVVVDPKGRDYSKYVGATLITPNRREACEALKIDPASASKVSGQELGTALQNAFGFPAVLVTLGADGMVLVQNKKPPLSLKALAHDVYDVSGAGDTVAAVMALGLAAQCSMEEAMNLANKAAAIAVSKPGTQPVSEQELTSLLSNTKKPWWYPFIGGSKRLD